MRSASPTQPGLADREGHHRIQCDPAIVEPAADRLPAHRQQLVHIAGGPGCRLPEPVHPHETHRHVSDEMLVAVGFANRERAFE